MTFGNFARSVLLVAPDGDERNHFRLVHAKHNLSQKAPDLLYHSVNIGENPRSQYVRLEWQASEADCDADSFFDRKKPKGGAGEPLSAGAWLEAFLRRQGETLKDDVLEEGKKLGFKKNTLEMAMKRRNNLATRTENTVPPRSWWRVYK